MKIMIGITGSSMAGYSIELIKELIKEHDVYVIMTQNSMHFIDQELIINLVEKSKLFLNLYYNINNPIHLELAMQMDYTFIVPATYNFIGKYTNGIADDFLTTYCSVVSNEKLIIAPTMYGKMYYQEINQNNLKKLEALGHIVMRPQAGYESVGALININLIKGLIK